MFSVDFFHLGVCVVVVVDLVEWGQVIIGGSFFFENAQTKLDHSVDAGGEGAGVLKGEPRCQKRRVVQQPNQVLDGLVALIDLSLVAELVDDLIFGVNLHGLLAEHIACHRVVTESLSFHDALHVGGPAVLTGDQDAGRLINAGADLDFLNLVAEHVLHQLAKGFEAGLLFLFLFLFVLGVFEIKTFLGD